MRTKFELVPFYGAKISSVPSREMRIRNLANGNRDGSLNSKRCRFTSNLKVSTESLQFAIAVATIVAANPLFSPQANAQEVSEDIESVFVLGQRRAYQGNFNELENPTAVQMIDGEMLRAVGALNLNDALDLSASVARQNNFGGLWNSFSIRGFSGDINLPSGFLVNGFNAGRGFGGPRDIVGIESVEILKGPRSALFGRGEPGGTVNLTTKRPGFETAGDFRATVGRWDQLG